MECKIHPKSKEGYEREDYPPTGFQLGKLQVRFTKFQFLRHLRNFVSGVLIMLQHLQVTPQQKKNGWKC